MPVEMLFAQVWTIRDGKEARMDMYSGAADALEATGLAEHPDNYRASPSGSSSSSLTRARKIAPSAP